MQEFETNVVFTCPRCGEVSRTVVPVPEPDWTSAENPSELYSEDQTEVVCSECSITLEAYVYNSAGVCTVSLNEYPNTPVEADHAHFSPEEDDWFAAEIAEDPLDVFMDSHHQIGDFLADHGHESDGAHLVNRMLFVQQVSALEAYLADTLIKAAVEKHGVLAKLIEGDRELSAQKFTLAEIASSPNLVEEKVTAYLRSIVYHNLARVDALYSIAFGLRILDERPRNALLMEAIGHRHDCVHRNGRDKDGNLLTVFTKDYIARIGAAMRQLVKSIDDAVWGAPLLFLGDDRF
ncbi:hypothetical protein [Ensifer sesbaniae]|uniref:hypothetical protein n=1 Tax=Ensifer sesbaniae TaxID=1214071 RepID=UPI0015696CF4|nr:hypothetical protein [Ensifer sesbaniae]NRQ19020.1 hypothetical protein [Ensifer sesbaniae]